jgi:hypothetical protein
MNNDFDELYEEWIDHVNLQPLTTNRIDELSDVINVNQQIINRIYSIRRHLEMADDDETFDQDYNLNNVFSNVFGDNRFENYTDSNTYTNTYTNTTRNFNNLNTNSVNNSVNNSIENQLISNLINNTGLVGRSENMFGNSIVSRLFSILLEGDVNIDNMEDVKVTLTNEQFDKLFLETVKETNKQNYESECNICMDEYKLKDVVVKLGCNHLFHKDCIYNWLCNERVSCPVCRKDTRDDLN